MFSDGVIILEKPFNQLKKNRKVMTPKEKAKELVLKFAFKGAQHEGEAKQFALIAVDEIVKSHTYGLSTELKNYWQEVKQEILAL